MANDLHHKLQFIIPFVGIFTAGQMLCMRLLLPTKRNSDTTHRKAVACAYFHSDEMLTKSHATGFWKAFDV
jgi:hypothetical protein